MNLLDENIRQDQEIIILRWGIKVRRLSREFARRGIQDPDILPLLHHLKSPTFFTHDRDFFVRKLVHQNYCLVWLDIYDGEAAAFTRRVLQHTAFRTQAQRMGKVVRAHLNGLEYWDSRTGHKLTAKWPT